MHLLTTSWIVHIICIIEKWPNVTTNFQYHRLILTDIDTSTVMYSSFPTAEVPPQLRSLVRLVVRAFFQPQHIVVLDILSMYPW